MVRRSSRLRYGPGRGQFGVLHRQRDGETVDSVVVLVHGGFWRWPFNRWVMALLARDAVRRGHTVFNIEYRRLGRFGGGGGWPETFDDVADAVDVVAHRFDGAAIVLVGHSAGGQLALATAARCGELIDGVVAMSAPTDLRLLSNRGSERIDHFVERAPTEQRWALTSPIEMVPTGVATVCVHGEADTTVRPDMSVRYVDAALAAGDDSRLVLVEGEHHRCALVPSSRMWRITVAAIDGWLAERTNVSSGTRCMTMGTE